MPLTDLEIRNAAPREKQYKLADGGGLYLLVKPNGGKYWRLKYRINGKEKTLACGVYPDVRAPEARKLAAQAKDALKDGVDPSRERKKEKRRKVLEQERSFKGVAEGWFKNAKGKWSANHASRVWDTLERLVFPSIGDLPISEVETADILAVVKQIDDAGSREQAGRVLQRIKSIYRYAVQLSLCKEDRSASIDPRESLSSPIVHHRASLNREELPEFYRRLNAYDGSAITAFALRFCLLTFVRPGELRGARWDEFDLEDMLWRIPAERMKMKSEHVVPLATQTIELMNALRPLSGQNELLFPGDRKPWQSISENTLTGALNRMGYKGRATAHGFRATAASALNEAGFNTNAVERQLAHQERNKVKAAYTYHAEYLPDRRKMMQWWADFLQKQETQSNVIPVNFG
ncbi:MAG: integrase arm-type DNA-binding domain-containing protein [Pseudomonadota bacterium]|nr:integrase arm-type DNA-binding domain-containing protein [Pseudomonadota bacterium]